MTIDLNNLTAEQKQQLMNELVATTFSFKAVHTIGDNLVKGMRKLADATQKATDATALNTGKAQMLAVPTAKKAVNVVVSPVMGFSNRVKSAVVAGASAYAKKPTTTPVVIDAAL
jgi:uncharacterized protein YaaW (UPF0174 family)